MRQIQPGESGSGLRLVVEAFICGLTDKQTMYQMIAFTGKISQRGGAACDPLEYKIYLGRLHARIGHRLEELCRDELLSALFPNG
jgi:hypothetical protein